MECCVCKTTLYFRNRSTLKNLCRNCYYETQSHFNYSKQNSDPLCCLCFNCVDTNSIFMRCMFCKKIVHTKCGLMCVECGYYACKHCALSIQPLNIQTAFTIQSKKISQKSLPEDLIELIDVSKSFNANTDTNFKFYCNKSSCIQADPMFL
jgi:hypothetical protein